MISIILTNRSLNNKIHIRLKIDKTFFLYEKIRPYNHGATWNPLFNLNYRCSTKLVQELNDRTDGKFLTDGTGDSFYSEHFFHKIYTSFALEMVRRRCLKITRRYRQRNAANKAKLDMI